MVIKEYKMGKELNSLEKIKKEIEEVLGSKKYDYNFKYDVSYKISLEIKPVMRNEDNMKIFNDFKDIQDYLITYNIKYRLVWWTKLKEIEIELDI